MAVSRWPASAVAVVSLVSKPPRGCVPCANLFALRGPMWVRARKSSPSEREMDQNRRSMARGANFFAKVPLEGLRWASIFAHTGTAAWYQRNVVPYMRERVGFLHYMKPSRGVSSACRSLM